jgi:hypothetical protein
VLKSGEHIGPAEIGLLATVGVTTVKVNKPFLSLEMKYTVVMLHTEFAFVGIPSTNRCPVFYRGRVSAAGDCHSQSWSGYFF